MSRLPFEAFLALRYLRPRRTFVSVITVISVIGVLLGVAVLIIVIAVMSGFDREWRDRILGFNANLNISVPGQNLGNYETVMKTGAANPNIMGVAPLIEGQTLGKTEPETGKSQVFGRLFRGVDPVREGNVSILPRCIIRGQFDLSGQGVLIGCDFAREYGLEVGDRLALYSPASLEKAYNTAGKTNAEVPLADDYTVRGIFDVGFAEFNRAYVIISLDNARELQSMEEGTVQAVQVKLRDPFEADAVAAELTNTLKDSFMITTWKQENADTFNALAWEKNMMFFILFFIMIVAAFGIVSSQITFVVQKTREIGILKAVGASRWQILWVFLSQSVVVGVLGVGLGFCLAVVAVRYRNEFLDFMRQVTHSQLLPASIYQVYQLPAALQTGDVLVICGTAFGACVLAGLFPAWKASRMQPVEALRYE